MASGSILAAATPMLTRKEEKRKGKERKLGALIVLGEFRFKGCQQKFQKPSFLRPCSSHHITSQGSAQAQAQAQDWTSRKGGGVAIYCKAVKPKINDWMIDKRRVREMCWQSSRLGFV